MRDLTCPPFKSSGIVEDANSAEVERLAGRPSQRRIEENGDD